MPHVHTKEKIHKCDEDDDLLEANLEVNDHLCASWFFYRIFQRFPDLVSGSLKIGFLPTSPLTIVKLFRYCIMADQLCQKTEYHAREILFKPGE